MTIRSLLRRVLGQADLNFLLTNRVPRRGLTRLMAGFSQIENPLVRELSIGIWRLFSDELDLDESLKKRFRSLHDCFIRELEPGARPVDPDPRTLVSPCDGIVGAAGRIRGSELIQAKGRTYSLQELLQDPELARLYTDGRYVTLRLKVGMYHRFHAPHDCRVDQVVYVPGDTWNVNPAALERVEKLYARNERAVVRTTLLATGHVVTLAPVAAILVASIRLHFADLLLHLDYEGPRVVRCACELRKGQEMGWFQHGSTIIVLAPEGFELEAGVGPGARLRMGRPLLRLP